LLLGELSAQGSGKLGDVINPGRLPFGDGPRLRCAIALTLVISNSRVPRVARFRLFGGSATFNGQLAAPDDGFDGAFAHRCSRVSFTCVSWSVGLRALASGHRGGSRHPVRETLRARDDYCSDHRFSVEPYKPPCSRPCRRE